MTLKIICFKDIIFLGNFVLRFNELTYSDKVGQESFRYIFFCKDTVVKHSRVTI